MPRCFLPTTNIDKIGLCATGLEVLFHHLVHYIGSEYFNVQRNVLYREKLVVSQIITLDKSEMTQKRSLVTATSNIRYNQAMSETFNVRLQNMKVLIMIKT